MDFVKFFSVVRKRELYFPSAWQLRRQDPFEGSLNVFHSRFHLMGEVGGESRRSWVQDKEDPPDGMNKEEWDSLMRMISLRRQEIRKYMYINSWHMSEHESVAMWKLYDLTGQGIAIQTTFRRLTDCFVDQRGIHVGCVNYINHHDNETWLGNYFDPFMHKHIALSHEREVRAVIWDSKGFLDFFQSHMVSRDRQHPDPSEGTSVC